MKEVIMLFQSSDFAAVSINELGETKDRIYIINHFFYPIMNADLNNAK